MIKRLFLLALFVLAACRQSYVLKPESAHFEGFSLKKASYTDLKGFETDDFSQAIIAFERNCKALDKLAPKSSSVIKLSADSHQKICADFQTQKIKTSEDMKNFIQAHFEPYLVLNNGSSQGQFTSYYEAEIRASEQKHGKYQYPVYGKPRDLVTFNPADFDKSLTSKRFVGKLQNGRLKPYPTRAEIELSGIDAPVILWADDPVDVFLMQIQGSAIALMDKGDNKRIRYADNNGQPFIGIGRILLDDKVLEKGQASMDKIRDWLKQNPEKAQKYMRQNPRYVFHQLSDAEGPIGALGVPLTSGRSLAVDEKYIPLSSLLWLETTAPDNTALQKLVFAQDIGGAIQGPIRGDYFWGHGEQALLSAGKMHAKGQYYILHPKDSELEFNNGK